MTTCRFGDIILVPFPFTDQTTTKKRPAVVISAEAYNSGRPDLIIMAITSRLHQVGKLGASSRWPAGREPGCSNPPCSSLFLQPSKTPWFSNNSALSRTMTVTPLPGFFRIFSVQRSKDGPGARL